MISRWTVLFLSLLAACDSRLDVQVVIPDAAGVPVPIEGMRIALVPWDRDSIMGEVESGMVLPRPHTDSLDRLFQAFRTPYREFLTTTATWHALTARSDAPTDSVAQADSARRAAATRLDLVRRRVQSAIREERARLRPWSELAGARFDTILAAISKPWSAIIDSTGADGWVRLSVPSGRYWVVARAVSAQDPNAEWYWNLPATGDTIRLNHHTGRLRPRY